LCIGFGDFLHQLDPQREWQEHLQHVLIFCKTHVQRNFAKKFGDHAAKHQLHQIWEASSKEEVVRKLHGLAEIFPELRNWIKNKEKPWILSGLTPEQSKIPIQWWVYARDQTGIGESSHFQENNYTGRKQSLLAACLKYEYPDCLFYIY
jgi:hypothetical protein